MLGETVDLEKYQQYNNLPGVVGDDFIDPAVGANNTKFNIRLGSFEFFKGSRFFEISNLFHFIRPALPLRQSNLRATKYV